MPTGVSLSAERALIFIRNPLIQVILAFVAVSYFYYLFSHYGPSERYPGLVAKYPNYSFSRLDALILLVDISAIAFFLMTLLDILTQIRAGMPDHLDD